MLLIPAIERRGRRMMAHLLRDQLRNTRFVLPLPQEDLAQERIQRLHALLPAILVLIAMLLLQRAQEPSQHQQRALLGIGLGSWRDEERGVLRPVGGELDDALRGEEEGRGGQGGEIAAECCD